jgi:transposase-like protein
VSLIRRLADGELQAKPTTCPFCRSAKIVTASKHVDSSAYWRCETCGQVWNVGRLRVFMRNNHGGR